MIRSRRTDGVTYICRGPGALLSLPRGGYREDAIHKNMFRERIRDNADSWFNWSRNVDLHVDRMDDLILVTGCTLVSSYALAVLDDHIADAQISLVNTPLIMKAQVLFGVIFVEPQNITIANSTRSVFPVTLLAVR